jgi:ATP-binding cassette subfamily F protein 3
MLQISDLSYRIDGRVLFDACNAQIAGGWKVGLVGRNGTGKSTLLRLIREDARGDGDAIRVPRGARLGFVAQEAPANDTPLLEIVLAADVERAALFAEAETADDPMRIGEIHARLADIDAYSAEARASEILVGLGFRQGDLMRPGREFSGGWRMRAALAGVLFSQPDLLLLDEPTNYLDLEGAAWLEHYIRRYPHTVVLVSHDRDLLNRSVTHILALDQCKLSVTPGGYDAYLRRRAERVAQLEAQKAKQDVERAHLQSFVDRFRAKASKARQAQSRIKMLEKMQEITVPLADRTTPFRFNDPDELAAPILELERADLGYGGDPVLRSVSLRLDMDDRIAIIGANGQGKTTLVKSIAQRLSLMSGSRRAAKALRIGYFSQDQLDELRAGETVLEHVRDLQPQAGQAQVRALAAQFGFGPEKCETKVDKLSGGEKVRLLLGLTTWSRPHILILDEPTSHLDIDSREALIHALNAYKGAVLIITHDTYLAEATADRLWLVKDGRVAPYEGDLADYKALVLAADREAPAAPLKSPTRATAVKPPPSRMKLRQKVETAERRMDEARQALQRLDEALLSPAVYSNVSEGERLSRQREDAQRRLDAAEAEWMEASLALESAADA